VKTRLGLKSAEKAGVGGSTPSLATVIPKDLAKNYVLSSSPLSVHIRRGRRNRSVYLDNFEQLSANVFFPQSAFSPLWSVAWLRTVLHGCPSSHCDPGRTADTKSCRDNTVRSKSLDIAHGRLAKEAAVFSVELADALVADLVRCARGVHPIHKHPLPCPLQP